MFQARATDALPGRLSKPRVLFDCGGLFVQGVIDAADHRQGGRLVCRRPEWSAAGEVWPGGFAPDPGAWKSTGVRRSVPWAWPR